MNSKNNNLKVLIVTIFTLIFSSYSYAEVHPILFKDDSELYSKTYYGMGFSEFKSKLNSSISDCQNASVINGYADKACKVSFKSSEYGLNDALVIFKSEKLVSVIYKINNEKYQKLITDLVSIYNDQPQTEKHDEKKGFFSKVLTNETSFWLYPDYLMHVSKFDINKYVENGPNYLYAMESSDQGLIKTISDEVAKKSKQPIQFKTASIDFNRLHLSPVSNLNVNESSSANKPEISDSKASVQEASDIKTANLQSENPATPSNNIKEKPSSRTTNKKSIGQSKNASASMSNWAQEPTSFMGLIFGEELNSQINECPKKNITTSYDVYDSLKISQEKIRCYEVISADKEFYEARNLPNIGINYWKAYLKVKNGKFLGMDLTFNHYDYLKMFDLFKAKYGVPTTTKNVTVKNRMGASYTGVEYKWLGDSVTIKLSEYGSKLDEGKLSIFTQEFIESIDNESKSRAEKFKDNL